MENSAYIISAVRTAIGSFNGKFSGTPVAALGGAVIEEAIRRAAIAGWHVTEVFMGQVLTAGKGQNPARQSAYACTLHVPATTINMMCGSGLKAVQLAYAEIVSGQAEVVVCGGQESMTSAHYAVRVRNVAYSDMDLQDTLVSDWLTDALSSVLMGESAEHLARTYAVSRERQDNYATLSQNRAEQAILAGNFNEEIVPIMLPDESIMDQDETPVFETTAQKLAALQPCFVQPDDQRPGSVTPGNTAALGDGAAAMVVCSGKFLREHSVCPLAKIVDFTYADVDPVETGLAPVMAIKKLLTKLAWSKDEVDLFEINEAFAVQTLLVQEQLGLPLEKINISGGAIALGHPIGASGTRVLVTLVHNLRRLSLLKGVAAFSVGGGMGIAVAIEIVRANPLSFQAANS